jgi:phosphoserine aminotransferase
VSSSPRSLTSAPIVIPAALKPADGRFGSGPSKVPAEAVRAMAEQAPFGTSHRQAPVRDLVARVRCAVRALLGLPDEYELLIGNGGSTAFWDAAAFGLVRERAQHVVCGEFSAKFAAVTAGAPFLADPDVRRFEAGTAGTAQAAVGIDVYAWPQNETSTGVVLPVARVADAPDDALMAVDATSSAGAIATDLREIDVYYFAPQKVFAGEGGLWLAVLSPAALARVAELGARRWVPPSLDLAIARANAAADQTYNTPAIGSLWLLAHQSEWLLTHGGVSWAERRSQLSSSRLYRWAERSDFAQPFVGAPSARSPVVGTIDIDARIDAGAITAALRANGIVDTEPYRGLGRNQLRIGMYPAVDPDDVSALTACIDWLVPRL